MSFDSKQSEKQKASKIESSLEETPAVVYRFFIKEEIKHQIPKIALFFSTKRFLNFIKLLESSLSQSFPSYSFYLKEQLELILNQTAISYRVNYLQEELYTLFESLHLFSDKDFIHLLDIKYLFMTVYSMKFLFQNYDRNKNMIIDDEELHSISCLLEPPIFQFLKEEVKNYPDFMEKYFNPYKVTRYILSIKKSPLYRFLVQSTFSLIRIKKSVFLLRKLTVWLICFLKKVLSICDQLILKSLSKISFWII